MSQQFATTRETTILFTLARRDSDSRHYSTLSHLVSDRHAQARLEQDGVSVQNAAAYVRRAIDAARERVRDARAAMPSSSAELALPRALDTDVIDAPELGPRRESYRIIATIVSAPGVPVA